MSVRQAQREIDSREFSEWLAFYDLEPFGELRADLRSGLICASMANAWRGKDDPAAKPSDFMPLLRRETDECDDGEEDAPEPQPAEELKLKLIAFTRAFGGEIRQAGKCPQSPASS